MRIVLWDIDGTLVRTGGAGSRALAKVVQLSPAAVNALRGMRLDGMTDFKIARVLCAARRHAEAPGRPLDDHAQDVTR